MAMDKEKKVFDTFDSGDGPTVPKKNKGDFDHRDSDGGLSHVKTPAEDLQKEDN